MRGSVPPLRMFLILSLALVSWPLATPARADLTVCNDTKALVGVAVGYRSQAGWVSEGWWRIPASACASVFEGDLKARFFYLHAEDEEAKERWRGPVFMCTSVKEFRIEGLEDCYARGFERTGFFEVDTGDQKNWRVRLSDEQKTGAKDG